jgi:hypothetical protein
MKIIRWTSLHRTIPDLPSQEQCSKALKMLATVLINYTRIMDNAIRNTAVPRSFIGGNFSIDMRKGDAQLLPALAGEKGRSQTSLRPYFRMSSLFKNIALCYLVAYPKVLLSRITFLGGYFLTSGGSYLDSLHTFICAKEHRGRTRLLFCFVPHIVTSLYDA